LKSQKGGRNSRNVIDAAKHKQCEQDKHTKNGKEQTRLTVAPKDFNMMILDALW